MLQLTIAWRVRSSVPHGRAGPHDRRQHLNLSEEGFLEHKVWELRLQGRVIVGMCTLHSRRSPCAERHHFTSPHPRHTQLYCLLQIKPTWFAFMHPVASVKYSPQLRARMISVSFSLLPISSKTHCLKWKTSEPLLVHVPNHDMLN